MSGPFGFAWAVPEVDFIPSILAKKEIDCSVRKLNSKPELS